MKLNQILEFFKKIMRHINGDMPRRPIPCPFCGVMMCINISAQGCNVEPIREHKDYCPLCNVKMLRCSSKEQALLQWNTRSWPVNTLHLLWKYLLRKI